MFIVDSLWFGMRFSFHHLLRRSTSFVQWIACATAIVALAGCVESHQCTAMGCSSQLSVTLQTPTGAWADGVYQIEVQTDSALAGVCSFQLPDQLPQPPGKSVRISCGTSIHFDILPEVNCTTVCNGSSCSQECTPIANKFRGILTVDSTPGRVELEVSRDGAPILVETAEPTYEDVYPNGPECGWGCRQASLEYTLP